MGNPLVALSRVGERQPQGSDRAAVQRGGRVDRLARRHPGEAPPGPGAEIARTLGDDRDVGPDYVPGRQQAGVHGDRLEVTAERLAGGDRRRQPPRLPEPGDGPGEPRRERAAVGHDIGDPGGGATVRSIGALDSRQDRGQGRVKIGHDDRHVIDRIGRPEQFMVRGPLLIGARHHHLQRRIPRFHDMSGHIAVGRQPIRDRHHQRVPPGAEPGLERAHVEQHPVADPGRSDQRRIRERANRIPVHGYHEFGSSGPLAPHRRDSPASPSDHGGRVVAGLAPGGKHSRE